MKVYLKYEENKLGTNPVKSYKSLIIFINQVKYELR